MNTYQGKVEEANVMEFQQKDTLDTCTKQQVIYSTDKPLLFINYKGTDWQVDTDMTTLQT